MYLQYKKEEIMFDTNELNKAGAVWQTPAFLLPHITVKTSA